MPALDETPEQDSCYFQPVRLARKDYLVVGLLLAALGWMLYESVTRVSHDLNVGRWWVMLIDAALILGVTFLIFRLLVGMVARLRRERHDWLRPK